MKTNHNSVAYVITDISTNQKPSIGTGFSTCPTAKLMAQVHVVRSEEDLKKLQSTGQLVVTDWFATWCGPCTLFKPTFHKMAEEYQPDVLFCQIDVDESKHLAFKYGISSMPTFKVRRRTILKNYSLLSEAMSICSKPSPLQLSSLSARMKWVPSAEQTKVLSDA